MTLFSRRASFLWCKTLLYFSSFMVASLCSSATSEANGVLSLCMRLGNVLLANQSFLTTRAKLILPAIVSRNKRIWMEKMRKTPENLSGSELDATILKMQQIASKGVSKLSAQHIRNGTYFVTIDGLTLVFKEIFQRTEVGGGKIQTATNHPRCEVIAYAIDRFLGMNVTPPSVLLKSGSSLSLKVKGMSFSAQLAEAASENLLDVSHIRILDVILGNSDRDYDGNILQSPDGKTIGIDFDLSALSFRATGTGYPRPFLIKKAIVDETVNFGSKGPLPGFVAENVFAKLLEINEEKLAEIGLLHGVIFTKNETENIMDRTVNVLSSIRQWVDTYGSSNIIINAN